ncbi:Ig-like domain repeat protein [Edaphobacter dinghuensis]|uniref:Ig-like domain repeat protein n=1 Tax=Edaphobacter dinghuensis TaxID=1560005 RepID=UPI00166C36AB|nr:Ig-like domain repeat protein [Edaphobacter dinghuensis]
MTAINEFTNAASTIAVGNDPTALAVDPASGRLYVANTADATVTVIDGSSSSVLFTIKVGRSPVAIAVNSVTGKAYVANRDDNTVTIIDADTSGTSLVAVGAAPVAIAVNPADNSVYVANQNSNNVTAINGTDGTTATLVAGSSPAAIAVEPTTDTVYVVNKGDNTVSAFDRASDSVATFSVGASPSSIAINPVTNRIYVPSSEDGNLTVIDGLAASTTTITVGTPAIAIAVDSNINKIYAANDQTTGGILLSVVDGGTNNVTEISGSGRASTIAIDSKSGRVYVPTTDTSSTVVINEATNLSVADSVGKFPEAIAFDPVIGFAFICNIGDGTVSIFDTGANSVTSLSTATSPIFNSPLAVAANPVTSRAYIANAWGGTVSVLDSVAKVVTQSIPIGYSEQDTVTVDPVANKVYVAVSSQNELAIIDGATNSLSTLQVGQYPVAVVVNPVTNKIYVLNESSNSVSVVDGATDEITATIPVPTSVSLALNPNLNQIYAAGEAGTLTVIDGATNSTSTIQLPKNLNASSNYESSLVVNNQTNRIYIADTEDANLTAVAVVDGATGKLLTSVSTTASAGVMAINQLTNQIYVATAGSDTTAPPGLMVVDGPTSVSKTFPLPSDSPGLAIDPATGKIYATVSSNNDVYVFTPNILDPIPLTTTISGVVDDQTVSTAKIFQTKNTSPVFTARVSSSYAPSSATDLQVNPTPSAVYYEVDGGASPWTRAASSSANGANPAEFSLCLSNIPVGLHTLYAFPSYGDEAGESGPGNGSGNASQVGNITAVPFLIEPGGTSGNTGSSTCASTQPPSGPTAESTTTISASVNPQTVGSSVTFTATVSASSANGTPTGTVTFFDGTTQLGAVALDSSLTAAFSTASLTVGSHSITAAYGGNATFISSTSTPLMETIVSPAPIATTTTLASSANPQTVGSSVTFTATVHPSSSGSALPTGSVSFFDGAALLGTTSLGTTLTATFTSSSLVLGSHSITATYNGDSNYSESTSPALIQSIVAAPASGDFTLSARPASLTFAEGGTGTITLTISPLGGFQGTVSLSCDDLPSNVACSFQPSTINVTSTSAQQAVLTLSASTNAQIQAKRTGSRLGLLPWPLIGCLPALGFSATLRYGQKRKRRGKRKERLAIILTLLISLLALGGCGVTFNGLPNTNKIIVSASANNGGLVHQAVISVTVNQ